MTEHGVAFPGDTRHPMEAVLAGCARPGLMGNVQPTERHWRRLLGQVHASGRHTCVISSEFFADAPDHETVARVVAELGGDRAHNLVTLRPLVRIMPSQWQQYVQNGLRATVVVVDDRDHGGLMRTFEQLLGLPENLLRPVPDAANRSLTLAETEMLRNLNKEFRGNGLPDELYSQLVRYGAVMHMKYTCAPGPHDVKIGTPRWALEAAAGIGAEMAERIGSSGVRVLGDPELLSVAPKPAAQSSESPLIAPVQGAHSGAGTPLPEEVAATVRRRVLRSAMADACGVTHSDFQAVTRPAQRAHPITSGAR